MAPRRRVDPSGTLCCIPLMNNINYAHGQVIGRQVVVSVNVSACFRLLASFECRAASIHFVLRVVRFFLSLSSTTTQEATHRSWTQARVRVPTVHIPPEHSQPPPPSVMFYCSHILFLQLDRTGSACSFATRNQAISKIDCNGQKMYSLS